MRDEKLLRHSQPTDDMPHVNNKTDAKHSLIDIGSFAYFQNDTRQKKIQTEKTSHGAHQTRRNGKCHADSTSWRPAKTQKRRSITVKKRPHRVQRTRTSCDTRTRFTPQHFVILTKSTDRRRDCANFCHLGSDIDDTVILLGGLTDRRRWKEFFGGVIHCTDDSSST